MELTHTRRPYVAGKIEVVKFCLASQAADCLTYRSTSWHKLGWIIDCGSESFRIRRAGLFKPLNRRRRDPADATSRSCCWWLWHRSLTALSATDTSKPRSKDLPTGSSSTGCRSRSGSEKHVWKKCYHANCKVGDDWPDFASNTCSAYLTPYASQDSETVTVEAGLAYPGLHDGEDVVNTYGPGVVGWFSISTCKRRLHRAPRCWEINRNREVSCVTPFPCHNSSMSCVQSRSCVAELKNPIKPSFKNSTWTSSGIWQKAEGIAFQIWGTLSCPSCCGLFHGASNLTHETPLSTVWIDSSESSNQCTAFLSIFFPFQKYKSVRQCSLGFLPKIPRKAH